MPSQDVLDARKETIAKPLIELIPKNDLLDAVKEFTGTGRIPNAASDEVIVPYAARFGVSIAAMAMRLYILYAEGR